MLRFCLAATPSGPAIRARLQLVRNPVWDWPPKTRNLCPRCPAPSRRDAQQRHGMSGPPPPPDHGWTLCEAAALLFPVEWAAAPPVESRHATVRQPTLSTTVQG